MAYPRTYLYILDAVSSEIGRCRAIPNRIVRALGRRIHYEFQIFSATEPHSRMYNISTRAYSSCNLAYKIHFGTNII